MKKFGWYFLFSTLGAFVVLGWWVSNSKPVNGGSPTTSSKTSAPSSVPVKTSSISNGALDGFIDQSLPASWHITAKEVVKGDVGRIDFVAGLMLGKLENSLSSYSSIPEVKRLKEQFSGKMFITYYTTQGGGASKMLGRSQSDVEKYSNSALLEICLFPEEFRNENKTKAGILHYDQEWRAVIMGAIKLDESWFSGFSLHELFHALKHRTGEPSSVAKALSDDWIEEELQAHELERKVLDKATKGKYLAAMHRVVVNKSSFRDPEMLSSSWTVEEVNSINSLFAKPSWDEANLRAAQYQFDLGMLWLAERFEGKDLRKRQIEYYRGMYSRTYS